MIGPMSGPLSIVVRKDVIEVSVFPKIPDFTRSNLYFVASLTKVDVVWCHGFFKAKILPLMESGGQIEGFEQFVRIVGPLWIETYRDRRIDGLATTVLRKSGHMQELWNALVSAGANPASPPPTGP